MFLDGRTDGRVPEPGVHPAGETRQGLMLSPQEVSAPAVPGLVMGAGPRPLPSPVSVGRGSLILPFRGGRSWGADSSPHTPAPGARGYGDKWSRTVCCDLLICLSDTPGRRHDINTLVWALAPMGRCLEWAGWVTWGGNGWHSLEATCGGRSSHPSSHPCQGCCRLLATVCPRADSVVPWPPKRVTDPEVWGSWIHIQCHAV